MWISIGGKLARRKDYLVDVVMDMLSSDDRCNRVALVGRTLRASVLKL